MKDYVLLPKHCPGSWRHLEVLSWAFGSHHLSLSPIRLDSTKEKWLVFGHYQIPINVILDESKEKWLVGKYCKFVLYSTRWCLGNCWSQTCFNAGLVVLILKQLEAWQLASVFARGKQQCVHGNISCCIKQSLHCVCKSWLSAICILIRLTSQSNCHKKAVTSSNTEKMSHVLNVIFIQRDYNFCI